MKCYRCNNIATKRIFTGQISEWLCKGCYKDVIDKKFGYMKKEIELVHTDKDYDKMPTCEGFRSDKNSRNRRYKRKCGVYARYKCKICQTPFCRKCAQNHDIEECKKENPEINVNQ